MERRDKMNKEATKWERIQNSSEHLKEELIEM
jgi:hypothetical protein